MRFYRDFPEALNELRRELREMGVKLHTKSVQNMDISNNPDYEMLEITNYAYVVLKPEIALIPLKDAQWCQEEFGERISGLPSNPGFAYLLRKEYWEQFFSKIKGNSRNPVMDYSYPERMFQQLPSIVSALKKDLYTRRAFLPIFSNKDDWAEDMDVRIPCSLGYWFSYRQDQLNMTYLQRSADFSEHFNNDIWLAARLKDYVAEKLGVKSGSFTHWLGSLHIFSKDVKGVF
jgi:thymidylate synthase